jgi:uncharacterized protein
MTVSARAPHLPAEPLGWPLLPLPDASGRLLWPSLETSVRQTIRAILMTRPGELILARQRGVGLADYLHEPNSAMTRRRLRDAILAEITAMETRIRLDAVEIVASGDREEEITVTIRYRIRRTGAAGSVTASMRLGV